MTDTPRMSEDRLAELSDGEYAAKSPHHPSQQVREDTAMSDGPLVIFRSTPEFYARERCGNKPNTVRMLSRGESAGRLGFADACMEAGESATIEIIGTEGEPPFFRRITDISQIGSLVGSDLWCISWQHEDGNGTYSDEEEAS